MVAYLSQICGAHMSYDGCNNIYLLNTVVGIICEGFCEDYYIEKLNSYFKNNVVNYVFKRKNLKGVAKCKEATFIKINKCLKELTRENINIKKILIWVDDDFFKRRNSNKEELDNYLNEENKKNKRIINREIDVKFSYENFEDVLMMHLDESRFSKWYEICKKNKHFKTPMNGEKVEEELKENFSDLKLLKDKLAITKYLLPDINDNNLQLALQRQKDTTKEIKCDFFGIYRKKYFKIKQFLLFNLLSI